MLPVYKEEDDEDCVTETEATIKLKKYNLTLRPQMKKTIKGWAKR